MLKFEKQTTDIFECVDFIDEHKDTRNYYYNELQECYKIVEDFIKRNNRILVGGMAIDYALKNKGSKLYTQNRIDYDFVTPEYHKDAYNLGNILSDKYEGISIINALHVGTMRVRYKFIAVADITYMPRLLFDKLETIDYQGFRCIHPVDQMVDQMRSIVYMVENPPREPLFGERLTKDLKRFCLLSDKYALPTTSKKEKYVEYKVPLNFLKNSCLGGITAGAYWVQKLKIKSQLSMQVGDEVVFMLPENSKITIYSAEPDKLLDTLDKYKKTKYRAILDKLPAKTEVEYNDMIIEIYDSSTDLILSEKTEDFSIIYLYGVLLYLLVTKSNIKLTELFHKIIYNDFKGPLETFPSIATFYGINNWSGTYRLSMNKQISGNHLLPKNAYPTKNKKVATNNYSFDPSSSEILLRDGTAFSSEPYLESTDDSEPYLESDDSEPYLESTSDSDDKDSYFDTDSDESEED